jgi:hypothetical protein
VQQQCCVGEGFVPLIYGTALRLHGTQPPADFDPKPFAVRRLRYLALLLQFFELWTWAAPVGRDDGVVTTEHREDIGEGIVE